ncbi:MAG TPA: DUF1054 family protein [Candidatus Polarisedimenticolaceae bacterium]|nr:DUF1054 family protein [Candidatus Polarisedimenticolaceae bacterium]
MPLLFEQPPRFEGLPVSGFDAFAIEQRELRRRSIIDSFHPPLKLLGEDLVARLEPSDDGAPGVEAPLHIHLPRLDWPRGYEPFCTWLALSREAHGYQAGPQLNVGVHRDYVAVRLGWDVAADGFGRFEFLCRRGDLGQALVGVADEQRLRFRVYASAPMPVGSRCVFDSARDVDASFRQLTTSGVWWELGHRFDLPQATDVVCSPELVNETSRIFRALLPLYDRIVGEHHERRDDDPLRT